jgi:hypothetical protein
MASTLLNIHWPGDVTAHARCIDVREDPKLSCSPFHITTTDDKPFFFFYFVSEKPVGTFHISSTTAKFNLPFPWK